MKVDLVIPSSGSESTILRTVCSIIVQDFLHVTGVASRLVKTALLNQDIGRVNICSGQFIILVFIVPISFMLPKLAFDLYCVNRK
jgi:hypothetical protein